MSSLLESPEGSTPVAFPFNVCEGVECITLVRLYRYCDECLTTAAIETARRFEASCREACLLCDGTVGTEEEHLAMLAGIAQTRPVSWYREHSPLGELSHCEATVLRSKTDLACYLVAKGGVRELRHMQTMPLPVPGALADPEEGETPRWPSVPAKRPEHYAGQDFDSAVWDHQELPADVRTSRPTVGSTVRTAVIGALSGTAGTVAVLVVLVGVLLW